MKEFIISDREAGLSVRDYSRRILKEAPGSLIYKFIRNKNIELNGKRCRGDAILSPQDRVSFFLSDETFDKFHGLDAASGGFLGAVLDEGRILYEDEDYLFYDKPAGLRSQGDGSGKVSLIDLLLSYAKVEGVCRPSVCNRLDTNTSGIVLCGKSIQGIRRLDKAIKDRRIKKCYRGIVQGSIEKDMHLVGFISPSDKDNKVAFSDSMRHGYKEVITDVKVIRRGSLASLVEFDLITGRKHQIRASMGHIGHPLVGDIKYGKRRPEFLFAKRQMLHACRVELPADILSGMTVFAPMPEDILKCMERVGISG